MTICYAYQGKAIFYNIQAKNIETDALTVGALNIDKQQQQQQYAYRQQGQYESIPYYGIDGLAGFLGAYLSQLIFASEQMDPHQRKRAISWILFSLLILFLISFSPYIDWAAHLGGLVVGFLLGPFVFQASNKVVRILSLVLTIAYFVIGFTLFYAVRDVPHYYF
eukprot:gene13659-16086_t